jgi:hypothetical protein
MKELIDYGTTYNLAVKACYDLKKYAIGKKIVNEQYYLAYKYLCDASQKSHKDPSFRWSFYQWLSGKSQTLGLRDWCSGVGCDYWNNIHHQNACDLLDSLSSERKCMYCESDIKHGEEIVICKDCSS